MIPTIKIREPFYAAGKIYNWTDDGYSQAGVGINTIILHGAGKINIAISGQTYTVEREKLREFVKHYKSVKQITPEIMVGVVPISFLDNPEFKWDKKPNPNIIFFGKRTKEKEPLQPSLDI